MNPDPTPQLPPVLPPIGTQLRFIKSNFFGCSERSGALITVIAHDSDLQGFTTTSSDGDPEGWEFCLENFQEGLELVPPIALANGIGVVPDGLPPFPPNTRYGGQLKDYEGTIMGHVYDPTTNRWTGFWDWNGMKGTSGEGSATWHIAIPIKDLPSSQVIQPTSDPCDSEANREAGRDFILANLLRYEFATDGGKTLNLTKKDVRRMAAEYESIKRELSQANAAVGRLLMVLGEIAGDPTDFTHTGDGHAKCRQMARSYLAATPPAPDGWRKIEDVSEWAKNARRKFNLPVPRKDEWWEGYNGALNDLEVFLNVQPLLKPPTGKESA
jgi:hypothetical protein